MAICPCVHLYTKVVIRSSRSIVLVRRFAFLQLCSAAMFSLWGFSTALTSLLSIPVVMVRLLSLYLEEIRLKSYSGDKEQEGWGGYDKR